MISINKPQKIKLIGYVRVSTKKQELEGTSIQDQETNIITYAKSLKVPYQIFHETISGYSDIEDMTILEQAISLLNPNDILYVTSRDRLCRDTEVRAYIIGRIKFEKKAILICADDPDFKSTTEKIIHTFVQDLKDDQYRKDVSYKVKKSIDAKKNNLKAWTGIPPFGITKDENRNLILDENEQKIISIVKQMKSENKNNVEIANYLTENKYSKKKTYTTRSPSWTNQNIKYILESLQTHEHIHNKLNLLYANRGGL
jgi:DNA invertase Pin-like site-specific DNA recombinase